MGRRKTIIQLMENGIYVSTYPSLRVTIVATHHTGMF